MNQSPWVLVTGGAKRLGREFCLAFARADWNVVCHFNTSDTEALETQDMVHGLGKTCVVLKQDLSAADAHAHLLDKCELQAGQLPQCIVNNASVFSMDDAASSYVRTLGEWHKNFNAQLPALKNLGFDERFIRRWNYYLLYCAAAFAMRNISVVQATYTRPNNPLLR
jgi:NAD(P)-dependent dehydrogenase (short-subunit alcohol dehydrogenase family)